MPGAVQLLPARSSWRWTPGSHAKARHPCLLPGRAQKKPPWPRRPENRAQADFLHARPRENLRIFSPEHDFSAGKARTGRPGSDIPAAKPPGGRLGSHVSRGKTTSTRPADMIFPREKRALAGLARVFPRESRLAAGLAAILPPGRRRPAASRPAAPPSPAGILAAQRESLR